MERTHEQVARENMDNAVDWGRAACVREGWKTDNGNIYPAALGVLKSRYLTHIERMQAEIDQLKRELARATELVEV